jgi:hypothetical protein
MKAALCVSLLCTTVDAHGAMNVPRSRNMGNPFPDLAPPVSPGGGSKNQNGCEAGACMWFNQGCCIGCQTCDETFNNIANITSSCGNVSAKDTLPVAARTIDIVNMGQFHPWRSPGLAPMMDSCGLSGGSTQNNDPAGGMGSGTIAHKQGARGSELPALHDKWSVHWKAGAAVEVSFGINANHGGGYQYRMCPAGEDLNEECFQKTPLSYASNKSLLRWSDGHEVEIDALRVTEGTTPAGSVWTRNPIPTCAGGGGEAACVDGPAFEPPKGCNSSCWGYQKNSTYYPNIQDNVTEIPAIVDRVIIPKDLSAGHYVVSWRWDCEQTPQIWSSCGDVIVTVADP